jgi:uncharacterized damage-inducible protein DinB
VSYPENVTEPLANKEKIMKEELKSLRQFFLNTISCLTEEDSGYAPQEGMYTVSQMVGHTAHTVEWFMDGAFGPDGFDLNFDNYVERMKQHSSLTKSIEYFKKSVEQTIQKIQDVSDEELITPLPAGPIMGGAPKMAVIGAISDHTAHHRGALSVYARLLGKTPPMPYGE